MGEAAGQSSPSERAAEGWGLLTKRHHVKSRLALGSSRRVGMPFEAGSADRGRPGTVATAHFRRTGRGRPYSRPVLCVAEDSVG